MPYSSLSGAAGRDTIHQFTLPNGLKVVLQEDHSAPVVAVQMWVHTGSADEPATNAGIAHVFEHMLFKGTTRRGVGEISRDVEMNGGDINAFTSYDMTVYHLFMASQNWRMGMDIIADAVRNSAFEPDELNRELEVVLEEVRRGEDDPDRVLGQAMFDLMFDKHPYKRPVIGYSETVEKLTRPEILKFLHAWYRPNNMTLVVAGDVPADDFHKEVEKLYGDFAAGELPERPRVKEPAQKEIRTAVIHFKTERPKISLAFHSVDARDPDSTALDILSEMLSDGINSVLFQEMKQRQDLAIELSAYNYTPLNPGVFEFEASFEDDKLRPGLKRLAALVHRLADLPLDEGELEAVKARALADFAKQNETIRGTAHRMGADVFYHDDPRHSAVYLKQLQALTLEDLRRVARRYLKMHNATMILMLPEGSTDSISADDLRALLDQDPEPDFVPLQPAATGELLERIPQTSATALTWTTETLAAESLTAELRTEGVLRVRFSNGLIALLREDHKAPIFYISTSFPGGIASESPAEFGWHNLAARLWGHSTGDLTPEETARINSLLGGSASGGVGRDQMVFSSYYLSERTSAAVALYSSLMTRPSLPVQLFPIVQNAILQQLATLKDNLFRYGLKLYLKDFYGDHPYNHLSEGNPESVASLNLDQLQQLLAGEVRPADAVLSVVGDFDTNTMLHLLAENLAGWKGSAPPQQPRAALPVRKQKMVSVVPIEREQTHIWWGFNGLSQRDSQRATLDLMDTLLSGMGGRLFTRLRDELSLAYTVTSIHITPEDPGFVALYIAGKPDKEAIALEEFATQLHQLREDLVPQEELQRARNYLLGTRMISRERMATVATLLQQGQQTEGNPLAELDPYDQKLRQVTAGDIRTLARQLFQEDHSLQLIVRSSPKPDNQ